jgi:hypothetical protein
MKTKITALFGVAISLVFLHSLVHGKEKRLNFDLHMGYAASSAAVPGQDLISSFNQRLEAIRNLGFFNVNSFQTLKESPGVPFFGGGIEVSFHSRFSLNLTVDFYLSSRSGSFDAEIPTDDQQSYTYYRQYNLRSFFLPVKASLRYRIPLNRLFVFLEGGLSYCISGLKSRTSYEDIWEGGEKLLWKARGQALVPFIEGGVSFRIIRHLSLVLQAGLPLSGINSFKITDCYEGWRIGEKLTLYDENGAAVPYSHRLRGLNIGVCLMLML